VRGTLEHLARQGHSTVLLDLDDVDAPDGTGASVLRELQSSVAASGGKVLLLRPPGWAREPASRPGAPLTGAAGT
jgi:anti-anti-sigma regulatory factor